MTIKSAEHANYPVKDTAIRVYYTNMVNFSISTTEPDVCEFTEFIQLDLGGKFPPGMMNGVLGKETIKTNSKMMDKFKKEGIFQSAQQQ